MTDPHFCTQTGPVICFHELRIQVADCAAPAHVQQADSAIPLLLLNCSLVVHWPSQATVQCSSIVQGINVANGLVYKWLFTAMVGAAGM